MTSREKQTSGLSSTALVEGPAKQVSQNLKRSSNFTLFDDCHSVNDSWDLICAGMPSQSQRHLLHQARREGLLTSYPIPQICLSSVSRTSGDSSKRLQLLGRLLHGNTAELTSYFNTITSSENPNLTKQQARAIDAAVSTPDLCLIQTDRTIMKSVLLTEIVLELTRKGQRVLLLSKSDRAVDDVLENLIGEETVFAIRAFPASKNLDTLSTPIRGLTFAERRRVLRDRSLDCTQQAQREVSERIARHDSEEQIWNEIATIVKHFCELESNLNAIRPSQEQFSEKIQELQQDVLQGTLDSIPSEALEWFGEESCRSLVEMQSKTRYAIGKIQKEIDNLEQELEELVAKRNTLQPEIAELEPFAQAFRNKKWWTLAYWKAVFQKDVVSRHGMLITKGQEHERIIREVEEKIESHKQNQVSTESSFNEFQQSFREDQLARFQKQTDEKKNSLAEQLGLCKEKWQTLKNQLPSDLSLPDFPSDNVIESAKQSWVELCAKERDKLGFLENWLEYLEESADTLASRLPHLANVVACSLDDLALDEQFGDPTAEQSMFDVLILDEADTFSEPQFLKVAPRSQRWILLGEMEDSRGNAKRNDRRNNPHRSSGKIAKSPNSVRGCFLTLWQTLHCSPRRSPYRWYHRDGRLHCRLRDVALDQKQFLESEPVADREEFELTILNIPRDEPVLAQVSFPETTSIKEAKEFIVSDLQEIAIDTEANELCWRLDENGLLLQFSETGDGPCESVELTQGVVEVFSADPNSYGKTLRLEFVGQNWDIEQARSWLATNLGWHDHGRTVCLTAD